MNESMNEKYRLIPTRGDSRILFKEGRIFSGLLDPISSTVEILQKISSLASADSLTIKVKIFFF